MEGQRISSYRVVRKIGQGGMGAVYEAVHEQLGRKAAIKLLRRELSQDPQIAMRFFNEARAASRMEHSGIVEIFEFGHLPDGTAYIIMEYLRGEALSARLRSQGGKLPIGDALRISRQIASALAATHAKGIVHRDLKPDNVMLVPDSEMPGGERVKILDFGVAKVVTEYSGPGADDFKTSTGMVLGTASYMPPEQCKGAGQVTDKADVYSLGIVLYRMLVGHLPFRAEGQGEVMAMHIFSQAKPLRDTDPSIPEPVAALVERMMQKEQTDRPSMLDVATELERLTALVSPGGQPVLVMVAGGPKTTGQTPTSPTLSAAIGQSGAQHIAVIEAELPPRRRRWPIFVLLLLLVVAGGAVVALRMGLLPPLLALGGIAKPVPASLPPMAPALVDWSLSTVPSDAQVIRKSDGSLLGTTPWFYKRPRGTGQLVVILRKPGYQDREVTFDESRDMSPHEALLAGPGPELTAGAAAADLGIVVSRLDMAAAAVLPLRPAGNPPPTGPTAPTPQAPRPPIRPPIKHRPPSTGPAPASGPSALTDDDIEVIK